jgi:hypothetical protein
VCVSGNFIQNIKSNDEAIRSVERNRLAYLKASGVPTKAMRKAGLLRIDPLGVPDPKERTDIVAYFPILSFSFPAFYL